MTIKYAILGLLSWQPFTGYDLKKVISDSAAMYWSGNNNQIYRTLVQLLEEGLVTNEVHYQENSPMKKIYSVTEQGLSELKKWVQTAPELPEFKNTFLIQLAWADRLNTEELHDLLEKYEQEVRLQLLMQKEKARRRTNTPQRTPRETFLWEMISENITGSYENELNWIRKLRQGLQEKGEEVRDMDYWVREKNQHKYIEGMPGKKIISNEQDALDWVAICGEHDTNRLMLHAGNLSENFFKLRTGLAGQVLQKFVNYYLKVAAVIPPEQVNQGRFKEMTFEANRGNHFRVFSDQQSAEDWLVSE